MRQLSQNTEFCVTQMNLFDSVIVFIPPQKSLLI